MASLERSGLITGSMLRSLEHLFKIKEDFIRKHFGGEQSEAGSHEDTVPRSRSPRAGKRQPCSLPTARSAAPSSTCASSSSLRPGQAARALQAVLQELLPDPPERLRTEAALRGLGAAWRKKDHLHFESLVFGTLYAFGGSDRSQRGASSSCRRSVVLPRRRCKAFL